MKSAPNKIRQRRQIVARLTQAGWSVRAIADHLETVTERTITRDRVALGISRKYTQVSPEQDQLMAALIADGASIQEAARTVGVAWNTAERRHPNARWDRKQIAAHAATVRALNRALK